jgi:prevent-host-death family protein
MAAEETSTRGAPMPGTDGASPADLLPPCIVHRPRRWTNWTNQRYAGLVKYVKMHEAKTHFSQLVKAVEAGEEVVVQRGSTPVAKIVAYQPPAGQRRFGALRGQISIADDFDEIPEEFEDYLG